MKSIVVNISADGEVRVEAVGYKGTACRQATAAIEKALGKVSSVETKPEWNQSVAVTQKVGA